ncbi:uncharacterized protein L201_001700 [Kwoniella dendrophila CBS 6074]|uniref:Uncharacterized protein n=1 Tax=Kwoniella dendrophila CBS 6074 TaxID=1295534 RepID=A0AAX4JN28_9TREE
MSHTTSSSNSSSSFSESSSSSLSPSQSDQTESTLTPIDTSIKSPPYRRFYSTRRDSGYADESTPVVSPIMPESRYRDSGFTKSNVNYPSSSRDSTGSWDSSSSYDVSPSSVQKSHQDTKPQLGRTSSVDSELYDTGEYDRGILIKPVYARWGDGWREASGAVTLDILDDEDGSRSSSSGTEDDLSAENTYYPTKNNSGRSVPIYDDQYDDSLFSIPSRRTSLSLSSIGSSILTHARALVKNPNIPKVKKIKRKRNQEFLGSDEMLPEPLRIYLPKKPNQEEDNSSIFSTNHGDIDDSQIYSTDKSDLRVDSIFSGGQGRRGSTNYNSLNKLVHHPPDLSDTTNSQLSISSDTTSPKSMNPLELYGKSESEVDSRSFRSRTSSKISKVSTKFKEFKSGISSFVSKSIKSLKYDGKKLTKKTKNRFEVD